MWKELSKLEKAGLIIGGIECVAGFGIAIYAHIKCKKESKEFAKVDEIIEETKEILDDLLEQTGVKED